MDVLLVDDSRTMRMLIKRALRQAGYRDLLIGEAGNGKEAIEELDRAVPKLILSDWNMPEMNGIELLKHLRAAQRYTPFGFITSEASAEARERAMQSGASFLLTKPLSQEDLEGALEPILGAC